MEKITSWKQDHKLFNAEKHLRKARKLINKVREELIKELQLNATDEEMIQCDILFNMYDSITDAICLLYDFEDESEDKIN